MKDLRHTGRQGGVTHDGNAAMNAGVRLVVPPDLMTESDELNLELSLPRGCAANDRGGNLNAPVLCYGQNSIWNSRTQD